MQAATLRGAREAVAEQDQTTLNTDFQTTSKELHKTGITDVDFAAKFCYIALYCVYMLQRDITILEHGASVTNMRKAGDMLQIPAVIYYNMS